MEERVYVVYSEDLKEADKPTFKEKIKSKLKKGAAWCAKNKETLIALTPVVVGGISTITKVVGKHINLRKEETVKELYCYDRSLGHYWSLRRDLTNKEWLEIDERKKNGERLADILAGMKVLK